MFNLKKTYQGIRIHINQLFFNFGHWLTPLIPHARTILLGVNRTITCNIFFSILTPFQSKSFTLFNHKQSPVFIRYMNHIHNHRPLKIYENKGNFPLPQTILYLEQGRLLSPIPLTVHELLHVRRIQFGIENGNTIDTEFINNQRYLVKDCMHVLLKHLISTYHKPLQNREHRYLAKVTTPNV